MRKELGYVVMFTLFVLAIMVVVMVGCTLDNATYHAHTQACTYGCVYIP
jgi:hypothetical protein